MAGPVVATANRVTRNPGSDPGIGPTTRRFEENDVTSGTHCSAMTCGLFRASEAVYWPEILFFLLLFLFLRFSKTTLLCFVFPVYQISLQVLPTLPREFQSYVFRPVILADQ